MHCLLTLASNRSWFGDATPPHASPAGPSGDMGNPAMISQDVMPSGPSSMSFTRRPPRFSCILGTSVEVWDASVLCKEIAVSLAKDTIKPVPPAELESGFYSLYFIVPKKGSGLRSILDLRVLNQTLHKLSFKILTQRHIIRCIQPQDWLTYRCSFIPWTDLAFLLAGVPFRSSVPVGCCQNGCLQHGLGMQHSTGQQPRGSGQGLDCFGTSTASSSWQWLFTSWWTRVFPLPTRYVFTDPLCLSSLLPGRTCLRDPFHM